MMLQLVMSIKAHLTALAFERPKVKVNTNVYVLPFSKVAPNVIVPIYLQCKFFLTENTSKGPFASVNSHMVAKSNFPSQSLSAYLALEPHLSRFVTKRGNELQIKYFD